MRKHFSRQLYSELETSFVLKNIESGDIDMNDNVSTQKSLNPCLMYFIFSTLESVGSMSGTLRVNASDEAFRITAQKFTDVKLENEKKS